MQERHDMILPETYREVLTNPTYIEGVRRAALKIMNKVESGQIPLGHLFDDIFTSFTSTGIEESKARDMTWNVIALFATAGPSLGMNLEWIGEGKRELNQVVKLSLAVIGSSVSILNLRSARSGHPYSYPPSVTTHCDNGKPYYFWMSAYLAREVSKKLHDPVAATAAVYTAAKGYQFISRTGDRKPERALQVDTFDGFNNVMRMDLTYSAAGTRFGIESLQGRTPNLNIDEGIRTIVSGAQVKPAWLMSNQEFQSNPKKAYYEWSDRFAPNSVFKLYNP